MNSITAHHLIYFLSRVSTLTRDIDIAVLSVRLSVCPLRSGILYGNGFKIQF